MRVQTHIFLYHNFQYFYLQKFLNIHKIYKVIMYTKFKINRSLTLKKKFTIFSSNPRSDITILIMPLKNDFLILYYNT